MKKDLCKNKSGCYADILYYVLSFCIPVAGMLLILKSRGFYPFKEDTLFVLDMHDQFMEFYASLRYILGGDNSVFYSWARSLGGSYIGLYAYYLANPLSWITVLFPLEKFHAAILTLTLLKIGCCGLTFSVFASYLWKRHFQGAEETSGYGGSMWYRFLLVPFAVSYALISYNIIFSSCLMWIDGVIMLPLILLGVEKILEGRKGGWYLISFAAACVFNYYTAYMAGLFAALYFVFRVAVLISGKTWKACLTAAVRFAAATFLAAGLAAPLLVPTILDLSSGKFVTEQNFAEKYINFPFLTVFGQFKNGAYSGILPIYDNAVNMPNIYCGYAALALAVIFFLLRKISLREKLAAGGLFLVLLGSFYFVPMNLVWHGMAYPNSYLYRYSFVMSFYLLYLAVRALCAMPLGKIPTLWQRRPVFECVAVLMMGVIALDMGLNGRALFYALQDEFSYDDVSEYTEYLSGTQPLTEDIRERDRGFYRVNQGYEYSKNDAMLLGYNGMSHYSSTFNAAVNELTLRLGMAQDWFYNTGYGSTPLTDSLLAVKYILEDGGVPDFYTRLKETEQGKTSYYNENALAIVYSAPFPDRELMIEEDSPFENQNTMLNKIAGTAEEYFTAVEYTKEGDEGGWSYMFRAETEEPVYLYMHTTGYSHADVLVNGEKAGQYFTSESRCILYLGSFEPGQQVRVDVIPSRAVQMTGEEIYRLQEGLLEDTLRKLQSGNMQIDSHGGGRLEGTIEVAEGSSILTSIPYDAGWKVKIDGKKVPVETYADTFIMVEAEPGKHSVSLVYAAPGMEAGLVIFAAALLLSIFWFRKRKVKANR